MNEAQMYQSIKSKPRPRPRHQLEHRVKLSALRQPEVEDRRLVGWGRLLCTRNAYFAVTHTNDETAAQPRFRSRISSLRISLYNITNMRIENEIGVELQSYR